MDYERPAKAFCLTYHQQAKDYHGPHDYGRPTDKACSRALKILTSLSSICVRRREDMFAAGLYFEDTNPGRKPWIVFAANAHIPDETRAFLLQLFDRLYYWSQDHRLQDPVNLETALIEIATKIFTFQAERWAARLHTSPDARATWDARLAGVRAVLGKDGSAVLEGLLGPTASLLDSARELFSGSGLRHELVDGIVRDLLAFQQQLGSQDVHSVLQVADKQQYGFLRIENLINMSHPLVIDDMTKLEDNAGKLVPDFSFTRYFMTITAAVRYAKHLVDFAASDRLVFDSPSLGVDFCDTQTTFDAKTGELVWGPSPADDRTHVGMRILQHLLEVTDTLPVTMVRAVGSSSPLCAACYNALTRMDDVLGLPFNFRGRLFTAGSVRDWSD